MLARIGIIYAIGSSYRKFRSVTYEEPVQWEKSAIFMVSCIGWHMGNGIDGRGINGDDAL
jgi:hypothetical protein